MTTPQAGAELLPCPFCGEQPSFTDCEKKDDRRYVEKQLTCCSIEMSASLSFGKYHKLTDAQIDHQLRSELFKTWNTRLAAPAQDREALLLAETVAWSFIDNYGISPEHHKALADLVRRARNDVAPTRSDALNVGGRAAAEWRTDIENAPRDGRHVLFSRDNWSAQGDVTVGFWHDYQNTPGWVASNHTGTIVTSIWKYWKPLPPEPGNGNWHELNDAGNVLTAPLPQSGDVREALESALAFLEGDSPLRTSGGYKNSELRETIKAALSLPAQKEADEHQGDEFFNMLWDWFTDRCGKDHMRACQNDGGLSADDFREMLDEHERQLNPDPATPETAPDGVRDSGDSV